jgi:hypothetical protein
MGALPRIHGVAGYTTGPVALVVNELLSRVTEKCLFGQESRS